MRFCLRTKGSALVAREGTFSSQTPDREYFCGNTKSSVFFSISCWLVYKLRGRINHPGGLHPSPHSTKKIPPPACSRFVFLFRIQHSSGKHRSLDVRQKSNILKVFWGGAVELHHILTSHKELFSLCCGGWGDEWVVFASPQNMDVNNWWN